MSILPPEITTQFKKFYKAGLMSIAVLFSGSISNSAWSTAPAVQPGFFSGHYLAGSYREYVDWSGKRFIEHFRGPYVESEYVDGDLTWMKMDRKLSTYQGAAEYCTGENKGLKNPEYKWRLPTKEQLITLFTNAIKKDNSTDLDFLKRMGWASDSSVWVHNSKADHAPSTSIVLTDYFFPDSGRFDVGRVSYAVCVRKSEPKWFCPAPKDLVVKEHVVNGEKKITVSGNLVLNGRTIPMHSRERYYDPAVDRASSDQYMKFSHGNFARCEYYMVGENTYLEFSAFLETRDPAVVGGNCRLKGLSDSNQDGASCSLQKGKCWVQCD